MEKASTSPTKGTASATAARSAASTHFARARNARKRTKRRALEREHQLQAERGAHNPASSKKVRRFYKEATGLRGTYTEAAAWYAARREPQLRSGASRAERMRAETC
jgi:hypothetical protein